MTPRVRERHAAHGVNEEHDDRLDAPKDLSFSFAVLVIAFSYLIYFILIHLTG